MINPTVKLLLSSEAMPYDTRGTQRACYRPELWMCQRTRFCTPLVSLTLNMYPASKREGGNTGVKRQLSHVDQGAPPVCPFAVRQPISVSSGGWAFASSPSSRFGYQGGPAKVHLQLQSLAQPGGFSRFEMKSLGRNDERDKRPCDDIDIPQSEKGRSRVYNGSSPVSLCQARCSGLARGGSP